MQILLPKVPMKLMGFWIVKNTLYVMHSLEYKFICVCRGSVRKRSCYCMWSSGGPVPTPLSSLLISVGPKWSFSFLLKTLSSLQNLIFKMHNYMSVQFTGHLRERNKYKISQMLYSKDRHLEEYIFFQREPFLL